MRNYKLSIVGILIAVACITANSMTAAQYYISSIAGFPVCVVTYTGTICPPGNVVQCSIIVGENTYWLCRMIDGGACQIYLRN